MRTSSLASIWSRLSQRDGRCGVVERSGVGGTGGQIDPGQTGIAPEPALLAPGEPPGAGHGTVEDLVEGRAVLEVGEELVVAEGLAAVRDSPAGLASEAADLVEEPLGDLVVVALGDPGVEHRPRPPEPDQPEREAAGRHRRRDRTRRRADPLPRVTSSARSTRRRLVGSIRAAATGSSAVSRAYSTARSGSLVELAPDLREATRDLEVVDDGLQVQTGAADQERPPAPPLQVGEHGLGRLHEPGHREVLVGIDEVDQVVGNLGPLGRRRLGRADVHPPVHLHRVDRDDLHVGPAPGQCHGQRRLPRRGGAHEGHVLWPRPEGRAPRGCSHAQPAATGMRVRCLGAASDLEQLAAQEVRSGVDDLHVGAGSRRASASADGKWTSLFWLVRPVRTDRSRLLGPSTTTSSIRPTRARCLASAERSTTTRSRSKRSATTVGGHEPVDHRGRLGARAGRVDERVGAVVLRARRRPRGSGRSRRRSRRGSRR